MPPKKMVRVSKAALRYYFYAEQAYRQMQRSGGKGFAGQQIAHLTFDQIEEYRDEFFQALDPR